MTSRAPADLGYAMPAEWEPHEATWLAWPNDPLTWTRGVDHAEDAYVEMLRALTPGERVDLIVRPERRERVAGRLTEEGIGNVRFHPMVHQDSWVRDYGPTFVVNRDAGLLGAVDWVFNAWGNKYDSLIQDDEAGKLIVRASGAEPFAEPVVMEGGSIEVNGRGTLLTTEQCLLNPNRNPELSRADIEEVLRRNLGATHILWLGDGIEGDDTDGHVDDLARFVDPQTLVTTVEPNAADPNHRPLADNLRRLRAMRDQNGGPFQVIELPMPSPVVDRDGRLPASYANFYIGNGAVLLPTFDDPNDVRVELLLQKLFAGRRVVPIDARDLIVGMGSCHCLTQQQPLV